MISDKAQVSDRGNACDGIEAALDLTEKTARYCGYAEREAASLRLLAEELVVGSADILSVFAGMLWVQTENGQFQIILEMTGTFTQTEREHLIGLTRDNKNTLPKGFFGKLSMLLSNALTGEDFYPYDVMSEPVSSEFLWDAQAIAERMASLERQEQGAPEMIGVEKKILNGLADSVVVSARPDRVRIAVMKALPTA